MCKDMDEQFALWFHPHTDLVQQQFIIFHVFKHFDTDDTIGKVVQLGVIESNNVTCVISDCNNNQGRDKKEG